MIKCISTSSLCAPLGYICTYTLFCFALLTWNVSYFPFRANKCLKSEESQGSGKPFSTKLSSQLAWEEMSTHQLKNPTAENAPSPWWYHQHNPQSCCSFIYSSPSIFSTFLWIWKGKTKSRPNSFVSSDSCPKKQNVFLNWALTPDSHASCTSCSVLVVVDTSYKKHNIFIFKTVLIYKTSMTAGPDIFLS